MLLLYFNFSEKFKRTVSHLETLLTSSIDWYWEMGPRSIKTASLTRALGSAFYRGNTKGPSVTPLSWTRDLGCEVFVLLNVAHRNSRHPSEKSITGLWPWVFSPGLDTKSDMLWPFAKARAAGIWDSRTFLLILQIISEHSCCNDTEIPHCLHALLTPQPQLVLYLWHTSLQIWPNPSDWFQIILKTNTRPCCLIKNESY